jgi:hypothetical protein
MSQYQSINGGTNFVLVGAIVLGGLALALVVYFFYKKFVKKNLALRANDLILLEVRLPKKFEKEEYEQLKSVKDITAVADQFFTSISGMYKEGVTGLFSGQPMISFEYVSRDKEIIFYVGVPQSMRSMLEKQIQSFYPNANIEPSGDFRVFKDGLQISYGMVRTSRSYIYPIRTYTQLDSDSVANITNVLSKIGEGSRAVIQIVIRPTNQSWRANTEATIRRIQEGKSVPMGMGISSKIYFFLNNIFYAAGQKDQNLQQKLTPLQEEAIEHLTAKSSKPGFDVQIRIVSLATTKSEADANLNNIFSSFSQFSTPDRNVFKLFKRYERKAFLTHFILRTFIGYQKSLLNSEELASIYHFPSEHIDTPGIRWFNAKRAPAPANMPKEGIILGKNTYRGEETLVRLKDADRRRHLYSIGMTGTGKSTFFESMILQDIRNGKGLAVFDPHGELVEKILNKIPKERAEDVIYFDPADTSRPMGVNLLEWKTKEQKDFLVQESIQIFYKLFDPNNQGMVGPQFEHWMRNAALTLMDYPGGGTLIEIPKLFTDDEFRNSRIASISDPVVKAFWQQQMAKTSDFHKSEMYNYFISKFGRFMTNVTMRNIIGQTKSAFDLREVMDSGKILLVNLSKGQIGEINSNLLGMIFVAKLFTAALSRGEVPEEQRNDFYLYVDEFQNFATDTFSSILSEARKFKLNLSITNQYIAQIPETIRDAIIGNVGTLVAFRIGVPDAEFMAKEFEPVANQNDLNQIDAYNAYAKILIDNAPTKAFSMQTIKDPQQENQKLGEAIKQLSRLKYGRDVSIVEGEIGERIKNLTPIPPPKNNSPESKV